MRNIDKSSHQGGADSGIRLRAKRKTIERVLFEMINLVNGQGAWGDEIEAFDKSLTSEQRGAICSAIAENLRSQHACRAGSSSYQYKWALQLAEQGAFIAAVWEICKFAWGIEYVNRVVNTWIVEQEANRQGFPTDDPDWLLAFLDVLEEQGNDVSLLRG